MRLSWCQTFLSPNGMKWWKFLHGMSFSAIWWCWFMAMRIGSMVSLKINIKLMPCLFSLQNSINWTNVNISALVAVCWMVPPIPSQGDLPWLVAKNTHSTATLKSVVWWHKFIKFFSIFVMGCTMHIHLKSMLFLSSHVFSFWHVQCIPFVSGEPTTHHDSYHQKQCKRNDIECGHWHDDIHKQDAMWPAMYSSNRNGFHLELWRQSFLQNPTIL